MIENPVNSPKVPPMAEIMSTNFAALSLVTMSNVVASKEIRTYLSSIFLCCKPDYIESLYDKTVILIWNYKVGMTQGPTGSVTITQTQ